LKGQRNIAGLLIWPRLSLDFLMLSFYLEFSFCLSADGAFFGLFKTAHMRRS